MLLQTNLGKFPLKDLSDNIGIGAYVAKKLNNSNCINNYSHKDIVMEFLTTVEINILDQT